MSSLSEWYIVEQNIVNSTQNFTTSTRYACKLQFHLRHTCLTTASAKYSRDLCHTSTDTASAKLYTRPLSHFSKHVLSSVKNILSKSYIDLLIYL